MSHDKTIKLTDIRDADFNDRTEPKVDHLIDLLSKAYRGKIFCRKAVIPMELIQPFSDYVPSIGDDYMKYFLKKYEAMDPPELLVYQKGNKFIMSDDYNAYHIYKEIEAIHAICTVIGETTITEGVEYGEPFKLQMPTIEVSE